MTPLAEVWTMGRYALLLTLVLAAAPVRAQQPDPLAGFDEYVQQALEDWEVPGIAVAVVRGDSVLFAKGYGVRELGSDAPVDEHTLFANASTTKAFTAAAAAILVDEDLLGWDDQVSDHLPELVLWDPYVTRELTLRDLLTHRLGFSDPGYLWYGVPYEFPDYASRLRYREPDTSFRAQFAYNNVGYAAAGEIAAQSVGTTWDDLIRTRILDPLGMGETVTRGADLPRDGNVAMPHDLISDTLASLGWEVEFGDNIAPAGSMYSSVLDMTRWMRFLLRGCEWDGEKLLSDASCEELLKPQAVLTPEEFYPSQELTEPWFIGYALGWFLQDYRGEKVAFHTGSLDGFVAIVGLLPDLDAGVVVFANRDHAEVRHALMLRVFDGFIGAPARDWSAELKELYDARAAERKKERSEREAARVAGTEPALPLEAYAGVYASDLFGDVEVRLEKRDDDPAVHLVLVRSRFRTADLRHWHYDTFEADWRPGWLRPDLVTFDVAPDGSIATLRMWGQQLERVERR